ncbi:Outer membrane autotransporter barrel [Rhodopseudomonas palustris BisB5]|uniref:Outer membrane autotransporter barrel n=1 Tax=Rhodopseudomonas palustris (strain BisB5) TaxID=316057 RepID=Q135L0_RHOPS|nr:Outer membrane autotransporter barrel [Rhodopseudomonas palustris BisB5]
MKALTESTQRGDPCLDQCRSPAARFSAAVAALISPLVCRAHLILWLTSACIVSVLTPTLSWASASCTAVNGSALNYSVSFSSPGNPDDGKGFNEAYLMSFATGDTIHYSVTISTIAGTIDAGFIADYSFGIPTTFNNNLSGAGFHTSTSGSYTLSASDVMKINSNPDGSWTPGLSSQAIDHTFSGFLGSVSFSATCTAAGSPTVSSVSPSSGPTAGGTSVTITGTNFGGATSVSFGSNSVPSSSFTSSSATQIVVPSPAGSAGTVHVTVTNAIGTSPTSSSDQFTYVAAPTIGSISPSSGPTTGGTSVTITGTNLSGVTGVTVGGASATLGANTSTSIAITTPSGTAGARDVVVTTAGGSVTSTGGFAFIAAPTIGSISPNSGPTGGGTSVTITGTNLSGVTGVTVGGASATLGANTSTSIVITTPSGTAGARDVVVTTAGGSVTSTGGFTYIAAPTIGTISPSSGPTGGGTSVTITGTNLSGVTSVTVGGASATLGSNTSTSIVITTPSGTAGARDVIVTTAGGAVTSTGGFTYIAAPTIGTISPSSGPTGGGTNVTITGTNLSGVTGVTVGGASATLGTNTSTSIVITTPSGTAGARDVIVTTAGGSATSTGGFTYIAGPTIGTISPNSGPTAGGTSVTITGTNLSGVTSVTIGGAAATLGSNTSTSIVITTPAGTAGARDVVLTTAGGSVTSTGGFTYAAAPTISTVTPSSGSTGGGTSVTITGTNLSGVTSVTVGGTAATLGTNTSTSIVITTPTGTAGARDVVLTTAGGSVTSTGGFTYILSPSISTISPNAGPSAGGTSVTISGTNLSGVTSVTIGGAAATLGTNTSTSIVVTTPAGTAGARDVVVTTSGGSVTAVGGFTYAGPPTIGTISPSSGPTGGGTSVTITGSNLANITNVTIGGAAASLGANTSTSIVVTTPSGAVGARDVVVSTAGGSVTSTGGFTYVAAPTISSISPSSGLAAGGTSVTITGTNLSGVTSVTVGGAAATLGINTATSIVITTPAGTAGARDVVVTTAGGPVTSTAGFTYISAATVTAISPAVGPISGGTSVTITGTNFTGATAVTIGGAAATGVSIVNATTITATTSAHAAGNVDVVVTTPGGTATGSGLYSYVSGPVVTSISPASGPSAGGTSVTITGSNLAGATAVSFGGAAATAVSVTSATTITATTPAHAAGAVDVTVTTPGGSSTGAGLFSYIVAATTTTLTSSHNPSEAGQPVSFTATVTANGSVPTGTVTFTDGGVVIGSVGLSGGAATLTTSSLTIGSHTIVAAFAANASFSASTSSPLLQAVNTPQDSLKLRAMQIMASKTIAQTSGAAISGAIDTAISEGFNDGGELITPSGSGLRFNFTDDLSQSRAGTPESTVESRWPAFASHGSGAPGHQATGFGLGDPQSSGRAQARFDDTFAAIDRKPDIAKAPAKAPAVPKDWLMWAEVKGASIGQWNSTSTASVLSGNQVNALIGLTRRPSPDLLIGVIGGYETFDYKSGTLNGRLKGDGWTIGSYAAWRSAAGLRFDIAGAYSGIGYDGSAGTAFGSFDGRRWLMSGGVTGSTEAFGFAIEPSAKVYALWESQNAYVDSLGTTQAQREFFTGRASAGLKVSYPWLYSATLTLAPYTGVFADYYFLGDNAETITLAGGTPLASVPLMDGWSARVTGGIAARFGNGAAVAVGGELGGLGGTVQIWTLRGRASVPF